jgi:hypothetical protein
MLHFAQKVPTFAVERAVRIPKLVEARAAATNPPGWHAIITKALGVVSMSVPELRQAYLPYPWPRLYEAPFSVASVVFEREVNGEPVPCFAPLHHPERLPLGDIQRKVRAWKADPLDSHGALRRLVRNARPPTPVRRFLWSAGLYWNGNFRARNFGTFAVNSVRAIGLRVLSFRSPLTSVWYYGAISPAGEMEMAMALDHRVFDGRTVDRAYTALERVLNEQMAAEVRGDGPAPTG